jgi:hypothetical protein
MGEADARIDSFRQFFSIVFRIFRPVVVTKYLPLPSKEAAKHLGQRRLPEVCRIAAAVIVFAYRFTCTHPLSTSFARVFLPGGNTLAKRRSV